MSYGWLIGLALASLPLFFVVLIHVLFVADPNHSTTIIVVCDLERNKKEEKYEKFMPGRRKNDTRRNHNQSGNTHKRICW